VKRPRILLMVLPVLVTVACGELVGIRDVPNPEDASAPMDARDATMDDSADAQVASRDGSNADDADEGAPRGDGSGATADGGGESSAPEASAEADVDGVACAATWNTYSMHCNDCGIAHCCIQLADCEMLDEFASDGGLSPCAFLVSCITSYQNTPPFGSHDQQCIDQGQYSQSDQANARAALSCIRASCPSESDCSGL
jgi:hypothetical protein